MIYTLFLTVHHLRAGPLSAPRRPLTQWRRTSPCGGTTWSLPVAVRRPVLGIKHQGVACHQTQQGRLKFRV